MPQPSLKGEAERTAIRLLKTHGDRALEYAHRKAEEMEDRGDEGNREFWERISSHVERYL